jgi:hypothetical protein
LPASDIVVVIYANGSHKLFASPDMVYRVLSEVQQSYNDLAYSTPPPSEIIAPPPSSGGNASAPDALQALAQEDTSTLVLTEEEKDEYSQKAIQKAKDFGDYLSEICNKSTDLEEINSIIGRALSLFIDDNRIIAVSSLNGAVHSNKIRLYLHHLTLLHYDKVVIQWYDVQFVNKFRKGTDGNYYGEIEFEQKFIGLTKENVKVFGDVVRKKVEVELKLYPKVEEGRSVLKWDVLLGDIGVDEVKAS